MVKSSKKSMPMTCVFMIYTYLDLMVHKEFMHSTKILLVWSMGRDYNAYIHVHSKRSLTKQFVASVWYANWTMFMWHVPVLLYQMIMIEISQKHHIVLYYIMTARDRFPYTYTVVSHFVNSSACLFFYLLSLVPKHFINHLVRT